MHQRRQHVLVEVHLLWSHAKRDFVVKFMTNKRIIELKITEEYKPTKCHLFYYTSYRLNTFRALLCPSSGARDYNVDYHIGRFVLGLM